jgi:septum formation protein
MKAIILASRSPRRQELLNQIGIKFRVETVDVEEEHGRGRAARSICRRNALVKAQVVAEQFPKQTVLGADTLVHLGDEQFARLTSAASAEPLLGWLAYPTVHPLNAPKYPHPVPFVWGIVPPPLEPLPMHFDDK